MGIWVWRMDMGKEMVKVIPRPSTFSPKHLQKSWSRGNERGSFVYVFNRLKDWPFQRNEVTYLKAAIIQGIEYTDWVSGSVCGSDMHGVSMWKKYSLICQNVEKPRSSEECHLFNIQRK